MADWPVCFNWAMDSEDPRREYAQVPDACPGGCEGPCYAIAGINSGAFPLQFAKIAALPQAERGDEVEWFYQAEFWNEWFAPIVSNDVAKRVLDMAVNGGAGTAVKLLQQAILSLWKGSGTQPELAIDGKWGPQTVAHANACDSKALVSAFQQVRAAYYQAIVAANPAKAKYLDGWLARARR